MSKPITDYRARLYAKWDYRPIGKERLRTRRRPGDHETIWCPKRKEHVAHQHKEEGASGTDG